jgi:hypothetical protein
MKQYYPINWINGMKVTSEHFIALENHFFNRSQIIVKGYINNLTYGLIPDDDKDKNSPRFSLLIVEEKIKFLKGFAALTPEGQLVQIPPDIEVDIQKPGDNPPPYYLVLSVNPYSRIAYGEINEQESPLRYPFALPEYKFQFLPIQSGILHVLGNTIIPIAKFSSSSLDEDTSYIPPCTSVQSHSTLVNLYIELQKMFVKIEQTVYELLKKPLITNKPLLMSLVEFFNQNKTAIDWYIQYQPPVFLFEKIIQIASIIYYYNEIEAKQIKDEEIRKGLIQIVNFKYNHLEISKAVSIANTFINVATKILPKDDSRIRV